MRRRDFITLLGGTAVAWPLAPRAQQPIPVIGILATASPEANAIRLRAFRDGFSTAGYVEGRNVSIEYRWAAADTGRLPELAAGLGHDRVAVLVCVGGTATALAAKSATATIPIVFAIAANPVEQRARRAASSTNSPLPPPSLAGNQYLRSVCIGSPADERG
jgi:putative tryptophan/tyrosine transport system substrate-binding protein